MSKPINIVYLVLDMDIGGLQWCVVNFLKKINRNRFNLFLVCLFRGGKLINKIRELGVEVDILEQPDRFNLSLSFNLAGILRKRNISLIHTHNTAAYIHGCMAAKWAGTPIVIHTEHGRIFPEKKRLMFAERILSFLTYRIITVSEDLRKYMIKRVKINPQKITVIRNGVDLNSFKITSENDKTFKRIQLGLSSDDFIVGNVARLDEIKDHKTLIKAFCLVCRHMPKTKLLIIGDGPLRQEMQILTRNLGIENNVFFLGERDDVSDLMGLFDLFVLSSRSEGISLTLLEAMACRKPIIATRVGGNQEIITDKQEGILVNPMSSEDLGEAMHTIINNPYIATKMASNAYAKVQNDYDLNKVIASYEDIYISALMDKKIL